MKVRPNKVNMLDFRGKLNFITGLKYLFIFFFLLLTPLSVFGEEKILRVLTGQGHAPPQYIEQFEKQIQDKYQQKVTLEIIYLSGPEDWYKTIRSGKADLVLLTHHHFKDKRFNYIPNRFLLPIDLKNIPNFKHVIPALQKADYLTDEGKTYGVPVSQGPYGLAYNTAILKTPPKSWNILWDPNFKGKYVIGANEYIYNANITALALGYSRESISNFDNLNNKEFKEKLRQLAINSHSFWIGVDTVDSLSGKPLATSWGDSLRALNKKGEPWKMAEPVEGMPCWIDNYIITWALADKPFLKKVAEEYINLLLSTDYQIEHILRNMSLGPIITNINTLLTTEEKERLNIDVPNFFKNNRILLHTYSPRDRNGLKLLWEEAMKGIKETL